MPLATNACTVETAKVVVNPPIIPTLMKPQLFGRVLLPSGLLGLSLAIAFLPLMLGQHFFYSYDLLYQNFIWRNFAHWSLQNGCLPLTYYGEGCGAPLLAEGQIGFFYPVNLLIYWLADSWTGLQITIVLHTVWTLIGTYKLARFLQSSRLIASLVACSYTYSGFLAVHLTHVNLAAAASWLPWIILFACRYTKHSNNSRTNGVFLGISTSMPFLAGHPQIAMYSVLCVLIWIWLSKEQSAVRLRASMLVLLGVLVAGIQLVPSYVFFQSSNRAGQNIHEALSYSANPVLMLKGYLFIPPPAIFNTWTVFTLPNTDPASAVESYQTLGLMFGPLFIGIAGLVMFLFFKLKGNHLQRSLVIMTLFWLMVTLGKWGGIHWLLSLLPGFSGMRAPARAGFVLALLLSLTIGLWLPKVLPRVLTFRRLILAVTAIVCFVVVPIQIPLMNPTEAADVARAQVRLLRFNYSEIQNRNAKVTRSNWQPTQLKTGELPKVPSERIRTEIAVNNKNEVQPTFYTAGPVRYKELDLLLNRLASNDDVSASKDAMNKLVNLDLQRSWKQPLIIGLICSCLGIVSIFIVSKR